MYLATVNQVHYVNRQNRRQEGKDSQKKQKNHEPPGSATATHTNLTTTTRGIVCSKRPVVQQYNRSHRAHHSGSVSSAIIFPSHPPFVCSVICFHSCVENDILYDIDIFPRDPIFIYSHCYQVSFVVFR